MYRSLHQKHIIMVSMQLNLVGNVYNIVNWSNNQNNPARQPNSSASVKYYTRWSCKPWQVAILGPLIWPHSGSSNSLHSSKTIISRCKDLIQQILGGSILLAPNPAPAFITPSPPLCCLSSGPALNRCPWKIHSPHVWLRTLTKNLKHFQKLESHELHCIL